MIVFQNPGLIDLRAVQITHDELKRLLDYDPQTGHFTWKVSSKAITIGAQAGHLKTDDGYVRIKIQGKRYYAHILAWFYMKGVWPASKLDHRNTYRSDNRFENLREATGSLNRGNSKTQITNSTGAKGVTLTKYGTYRATIMKDGKRHSLGCFTTKEAAIAAYAVASKELYGEFSFAHIN